MREPKKYRTRGGPPFRIVTTNMKRAALTFRSDGKISPYADALRLVGVEPVFVTPEEPLCCLDGVAGLVLSGGSDVNPRLYGQDRHPRCEEPDDDRDSLERELLNQALEKDIPVFAICRGMQLFNVAHEGGTLVQHIDGHEVRGNDPGRPAHNVFVEAGTALAGIIGAGEHPVNSRHHQAVGHLGSGLIVSARAHDGTIEGIERPGHRFAIAVQWHPENQVRAFPEQCRLFEAFKEAL